ncbi:hypothetical protein [Pseudoxanthomonas sacheonensis]|uniref:hypothetical protein n=1 Tax=Pseudoxanthomonas sacheonensis TaxID=443615 RepID=UPI0013D7309E|nr:hypothetical protein [Pseudoxanthomonas sacheonensis]
MRPIYRFISLKLGRAVHVESGLEHQVAMLLDACPTVDWFAEQPVMMEFDTPQGLARHIPDFAVAHRGRPWFLELKFARDLDAVLIERTQHLTELLSAVGVGYRLITERDLPGPTRLSNAWSLLQRGRGVSSEHQSLLAYHQVSSTPGISLGELGWSMPANAIGLARDLMQGRLHTDLALPLSSESRIWASGVEGGWLWA